MSLGFYENIFLLRSLCRENIQTASEASRRQKRQRMVLDKLE